MAPKDFYAGGYSPATAEKLKNVALPDKICCATCKKWKAVDQYSNKQLNDLRYKMSQFGNLKMTSNRIRCRVCTGTQVTELTCVLCDEVKPLSGFGKVHRGNPDDARCTKCVEDLSTVEPGAEDLENESDDDDDVTIDSNPFDRSDASTIDSDGGATLPRDATDLTLGINQRLTSMSLAQHQSMINGSENLKLYSGAIGASSQASSTIGLMSSDSGTSELNAQDGNVWTRKTRYIPVVPKQYTGYDSSGVAHSRYQVPSSVASVDSFEPYQRPRNDKFPRVSRKTPIPTLGKSKVSHSKVDYSLHGSDDDEDDDADYALPS